MHSIKIKWNNIKYIHLKYVHIKYNEAFGVVSIMNTMVGVAATIENMVVCPISMAVPSISILADVLQMIFEFIEAYFLFKVCKVFKFEDN